VHLRGWQAPDAAKGLIAAADLLVVPSVIAPDGDRDGIPNVILEAFAAGTPVVATRLGGIAEAVMDGYNGILVEPGDVVAMARAIEGTLGDFRLRAALSRAARKTVTQQFDIGANTRQLAELFTRLCPTA
jgi:glycosyltransferase involved in cell wall biosynthesis